MGEWWLLSQSVHAAVVLVLASLANPQYYRFPYGVNVGMMAAQPSAPVQYTGQPTGPGGQPAPHLRPLFPSAQPGTPSPGPPASRATFPGTVQSGSVLCSNTLILSIQRGVRA